MLRDAIIVVPTLLTGALVLVNALEASWRRPDEAPFWLIFLAFLFGVLVWWYRSKRAADRERDRDRGRAEERPAPATAFRPLTPGLAVLAFGVGAPASACWMAWMTCLTTRADPGVVWGVAGLLGVTAMACGTFLLTRLHGSPFGPAAVDRAPRNGHDWPAAHKPEVVDPDAFDFAGRRG